MVKRTNFGDGGYRVSISSSKTKETPEEFAATKDQATYTVAGEDQLLNLDGKIDDALLSKFGKPEVLITDFRHQLGPHLSDLEKAREALDKGETNIEVDLGSKHKWLGFKKAGGAEPAAYIFTAKGTGKVKQHVIVNPNDDGGFLKLLTKSADGKVAHEVEGCYFKDNQSLTWYFGESLSVRS